jgi:uncharacterized protein (TIGR03000 family)
MTKFANFIAPFVPCAGIKSLVPCKCHDCCHCACACGCGCECGVNWKFWYVPPYSIGGCCLGCGWQGFYDCGGVVIAQVYGLGCFHGCEAPVPGIGHAPGPAGIPVTPAAPAEQQQRQMPRIPEGEPASAAKVVIKAPVEMRILVAGQLTQRTGPEMTFVTPALKRGNTYSYVFTAEIERDGQKMTETRKVLVRPGEQAMVDFSRPKEPTPPIVDTSRVAGLSLRAKVD